ncbi:MAG: DNA-3-methyladenine glycosylase 2 family protein [Pseudomonadota bacterium]
MSRIMTRAFLKDAATTLATRDSDLAAILAELGPPTPWRRPQGFATLCYIVYEQQVSLASAEATYHKVCALMDAFTPENYLGLSDLALRSAGVSRQKSRYTRLVAHAILDGSLPIHRFTRYSDEEVRARLTAITGIGNWTADVYLMAALRRPDLWPVGDLALVKAIKSLKQLEAVPDKPWLDSLGERYRPFRSVAARLYWDYYLSRGGRLP